MDDPLFRTASAASAWWNVTKTLVETVFFWLVFVLAIPIGISIVEIELAIQRFPGITGPAAAALALFTVFGLWAALTLAIKGRGTSLPVDEARRLVVTGPYAYLRHPLAVAAIGQASAVGLALGSIPVLIYVIAATGWWYFYPRPREEQHLADMYGTRWNEYRRAVRAVRPRLKPYRPAR